MGLTTLTTTPHAVTGTASQCGATAPAPIARGEAERRATLLKAVADPARLQLLSIVRASESGEACVCDMADAVGLSQPTVSHHLKVLVDAGVLTRERRGTWAWYTLVPDQLSEISSFLD
ncbi:metalloregulator ArsR/SmtB family transcription factor [Knoellia sp. 3-2P3]|uniref:ArsR/SmtB family transcription factor n=1 Tax=unclassified Knoellia TaxID=2618719 RepID=UPI0023DA19B8|nr:metalloregulator ArsR/SmtB family transcription factor [Knoellia sp. 3-2P3]MDF2094232.1 metalloregulator ArsR/SmtB family transcription factor [Knoellia sp. 3-2P3]